MKWYITVLKKYAVFSGRARRKEYWMFVLFNLIFQIVATVLDNVLGTTIEDLRYGVIYNFVLVGSPSSKFGCFSTETA